jgi:hypothetical protein
MNKDLYVEEDGSWQRSEKVVLMIEGLNLGPADDELDYDWGCLIMGQIMQDMDFNKLQNVEFEFGRSNTPEEALPQDGHQSPGQWPGLLRLPRGFRPDV